MGKFEPRQFLCLSSRFVRRRGKAVKRGQTAVYVRTVRNVRRAVIG